MSKGLIPHGSKGIRSAVAISVVALISGCQFGNRETTLLSGDDVISVSLEEADTGTLCCIHQLIEVIVSQVLRQNEVEGLASLSQLICPLRGYDGGLAQFFQVAHVAAGNGFLKFVDSGRLLLAGV